MEKKKIIKDLKVGDTVYLYSIGFTLIHHVLAGSTNKWPLAEYCGKYKVTRNEKTFIDINTRRGSRFSYTNTDCHIVVQQVKNRDEYGNIYFISTEPISNIEEEFKIMLNNFFIETAEILFSHCYKELQNKSENLSIGKITTVPVKVVEIEYNVSQYNSIYTNFN